MDFLNQMPELASSVVVLIIIGKTLKETSIIPDNFIPLILTVSGALGSVALSLAIDTRLDIANAIVRGIISAGTAVYGNQLYKQTLK